MAYRSNLPHVFTLLGDARRGGLIAAAEVLKNEVKSGLRGGYTSGDYVTGNVMNSVTRSEPEITPSQGEIKVGTNVKYALFWELGFWKWPAYFSKQLQRWVSVPGVRNQRTYHRKEVWMPALTSSADRLRAAYAAVHRRILEGG